ncbi:MAG: hypothetical protein JKY42_01550 [Flavobacteriales bacterium]|nr:hypothetical protein [Flavobacteriales bacterium]
MFNITNYAEHPSNPLYTVYKYGTPEEFNAFQELLQEAGLFYEADKTENRYGDLYVVAVKNKDEKLATKLNYIAIGKYRKPFVENKVIRAIIYTITIALLGFAITGLYLSK